MENTQIVKISDTELGIVQSIQTVYSKDYIDGRVADYDTSIANLTAESQYWRDLQAQAVALSLVNNAQSSS
jgi:hypothetical protein